MIDVGTAHVSLIDDRFTQLQALNGVTTLPIAQAYQEFDWVKSYFKTKPTHGYLVWVKEQPSQAITLCALIETDNFKQELSNLIVVESDIKVELNASCQTASQRLSARHHSQGQLILKPNSSLKYIHEHFWGTKDKVNTDYQFHLQKNSKLEYLFQTQHSPETMDLKNQVYLASGAQAKITLVADCYHSKLNLLEKFYLQGEASDVVSRLRLVGREKAIITATSQLIAQAAGKGHLDCRGLNLANSAKLELVPSLFNQHPEAELTHEAAVGKIAPDQLHYLRSRGLSEDEAINLIIIGFLAVKSI